MLSRFYTMSGPLANNHLEKWLGVIRRGTYQAASEDRRWAYEPVSALWPDIDPDSDSSNDELSDEGSKYQENLDYQEQEEVVLVTCRNPRSIRRGDQIALIQIKMDIERSKDKLSFINHMSAGSTHTKWYLVQVDMDHLEPVSMSNYGVYCCRWYIIQYEECKKYPTTKCRFCPETRMKNQEGTLGKMLPVRSSKIHNVLHKNQTYMWYKYDI